MKRVIIESPCAGATEEDTRVNMMYARRCVWDSLKKGEAPYASHVMFCQPELIDDRIPHEREMGMNAGFAWGAMADLCAVYTNFGISSGMQAGIDRWRHKGIPVEYRKLENIQDIFWGKQVDASS